MTANEREATFAPVFRLKLRKFLTMNTMHVLEDRNAASIDGC
jgi:hypothetical protein